MQTMPSFKQNETRGWPENVGILAMEIYFPYLYVDQTELEAYDGVSTGKYTVGLGQDRMGFCSDREDINSLCLTVTSRLLERTGVPPSRIGRLEVGTETLVDKSKSVKTVLMQLFEEAGNTDIEGVDTTNACYGGTAALFNAAAWVESSAWDDKQEAIKNALSIMVGYCNKLSGRCWIMLHAACCSMPERIPTMERCVRSTYMSHVYDFYKPDLLSEYPRVDGKLSVECYSRALDKCYAGFCKKARAVRAEEHHDRPVTLDDLDAMLFHAPYGKLVQKSLARLVLNDFLRDSTSPKYASLAGFSSVHLEESVFDRDVEKAFMKFSQQMFEDKTKPSLLVSNQVGNMYTPSLYSCLASYLASFPVSQLAGKRIGMFSYGSGLAATLFSLCVTNNLGPDSALHELHASLVDLRARLAQRRKVAPEEFALIMKLREETHHQGLSQSKEALLKSYTKQLKDDMKSMVDNFTEIIKSTRVPLEDEGQVHRPLQGIQDHYEMTVRAANIVRAGESLMKLISDIKQYLILNDFPFVNDSIAQNSQRFCAFQMDCDQRLMALRDDMAAELYELEEEYYSSCYKFTVYSPVKTPPSAKFPPKAGSGRTPLLARENRPNFPPEAHRVSAKALAFLFGAKPDANRPLAAEVVKDPSKNSKEPDAGLVTREEVQGIWESVVVARLRCLIGEEATDGNLNGFHISGAHVLHNMYRLSRNGVVILLDKSDDLPKWIINAMKCLIHWPRASGAGSCLPNYPGFELDVLKVVSEFFSGLGTALVPHPILRLFYHAFGPLTESCKVPEEPPTPDASVENLLHSMSILAQPVEATAKSQELTKPSLQPSLSGRHLVYRTAFESADPVTVLVESQGSVGSVERAFALSAETASTISSCSGGFARPLSPPYSDIYSDVYNLACSGSVAGFSSGFDTDKKPIGVPRSSSVEDLRDARHFTHATMSAPKEALVRSTASLNVDGFLTLRQIKREQEARRGNMLVGEGYVNLGYGSSGNLTNDWQVALQRSAGSVSYTTAPTQVSVASSRDASFVSASDSVTCIRYSRSNPSCESLPVLAHSTPAETGKTAGPFYANISSLRPRENAEDLRRAVKVMQVASLLLPPCRRRYLHLLLRFIYKTSRNQVLTLSPHHSNMSVVCPFS
ncbi:hypothetical protein HPB52_009505 [Rhipicephalus sanguineus]|uniref:hydroxymethylglutaryl-CoA synthase n=1 Tax=Rhipicephalus sanguineus TaxID=34632 RepID=A0A9D4PCE5_RHISA|nr:hypothetical protein HPB52_009505 [Rhipicephalus sanguineus]